MLSEDTQQGPSPPESWGGFIPLDSPKKGNVRGGLLGGREGAGGKGVKVFPLK